MEIKNKLFFLLKIVISGGILYFLFAYKIDIAQILENLKKMNPIYILLSFTSLALFFLLVVLKWKQILFTQNYDIPYFYLLKLYLIGMFFNVFLPSTIGGDGYRIYRLVKYSRKKYDAALSVFVDRLSGFFTLLLLGGVAALIGFKKIDMRILLFILGLNFTFIVFLYIITRNKTYLLANKLVTHFKLNKISHILTDLYKATKLFTFRSLLPVLFLSFSAQFSMILLNYFIVLGLNLDVSLTDCSVYFPIIAVISTIPISLGGLGLREGSYVYFFHNGTGISENSALAIAILFFAITISSSILGGILYLFSKDERIMSNEN